MPSLLHHVLRTGLIAGVMSLAVAAAASRARNDRAATSINAVSHIAWGGRPPAHEGPGGRNFMVGTGLHLGASVFWAVLFESVLGRFARRSASNAWSGGAAIAGMAYCIDYHIVPKRLRPGMEAYLSKRGLYAVYAALAAGFALAAHSDRAGHRRDERTLAETHATMLAAPRDRQDDSSQQRSRAVQSHPA
jgi:hypothetical protein